MQAQKISKTFSVHNARRFAAITLLTGYGLMGLGGIVKGVQANEAKSPYGHSYTIKAAPEAKKIDEAQNAKDFGLLTVVGLSILELYVIYFAVKFTKQNKFYNSESLLPSPFCQQVREEKKIPSKQQKAQKQGFDSLEKIRNRQAAQRHMKGHHFPSYGGQ